MSEGDDRHPFRDVLTPRFQRMLVSVLSVELVAWIALWLLQRRYP